MSLPGVSRDPNADQAAGAGAAGPLEQLDMALGRVRRLWEQPGIRDWIAARIDLDEVDASVFRTMRAADQLGPDGASVNAIAALLRIDASTASRFLDRTRALGFVERTPSSTDRRKSSFVLTVAGREQLLELRCRRVELLHLLTTEWSLDDIDALTGLLARFDDAVAEFGGTHGG